MFDKFGREEWKALKQSDRYDQLPVSRDYVRRKEIVEVYLPLMEYLGITYDMTKAKQQKAKAYLKQPVRSEPFVIGISGGVSVGKSTVAVVMKDLLQQIYPTLTVNLVNTDGFLYPNVYLSDHGILDRKGFPESYDLEALKTFIYDVRRGAPNLAHPIYSHERYDIVPNQMQTLEQPDILIVEGVVVLQTPLNPPLGVRDFFDVSIYVDAEFENVFEWFNHRYRRIFAKVKNDPTSFYYEMAQWPEAQVLDYARNIWATINTPNLEQYIAPTRDRANMVLHKTTDHEIDAIYIRRF